MPTCTHLSKFQSTPSVWRETTPSPEITDNGAHFNPLPPYGGRRYTAFEWFRHWEFQSTPSVWRETRCSSTFAKGVVSISIHSLRMEGDRMVLRQQKLTRHFNPLPPYGGRRLRLGRRQSPCHFNPLPPYGGRPLPSPFAAWEPVPFQSTPSVWRETRYCISWSTNSVKFQSTPSVWRETTFWLVCAPETPIFQSTPSVWRETFCADGELTVTDFNPLPPYGGRP